MLETRGQSAMVTGGASGLGAATAHRLAKQGMHVLIVDRDETSGMRVAGDVGGRFAHADVTDDDQVASAVQLASTLGPLRVLVHCAGITFAARTLNRDGQPCDLESYERVIRTNLIGTINTVRLAAAEISRAPAQTDGQRGAIVLTASIAAFDGQVGQTAYAASKGGVVAMTLPLARDLAVVGIRVNTIAPGLFDTPIYGNGESAQALKQQLSENLVFPKRFGKAEEFASLAWHCIANSYLNGETIRLDGATRLPPK